jgi:hypothetical protein
MINIIRRFSRMARKMQCFVKRSGCEKNVDEAAYLSMS